MAKKPEKKLSLTAEQLEKLKEVAKHGMSDEDIARLFNMDEKELINLFFKEIYEGRIEGKAIIQAAAFEMAQISPPIMKFWLQAQAKWVEKHETTLNHYNANMAQEEEELDFTQLTKDELRLYEALRNKAKKVRVNINRASEGDREPERIH